MHSELVPSYVQHARHRYLFTYSGSWPEGRSLADYSRQECVIVREFGPEEVDIDEVGRMFRIRFDDGTTGDAFADELLCLHDGSDASDCPLTSTDHVDMLRDRYPGYFYDGRDGSIEADHDDEDYIAEQDAILKGIRTGNADA